jgi:hypothetical protein
MKLIIGLAELPLGQSEHPTAVLERRTGVLVLMYEIIIVVVVLEQAVGKVLVVVAISELEKVSAEANRKLCAFTGVTSLVVAAFQSLLIEGPRNRQYRKEW